MNYGTIASNVYRGIQVGSTIMGGIAMTRIALSRRPPQPTTAQKVGGVVKIAALGAVAGAAGAGLYEGIKAGVSKIPFVKRRQFEAAVEKELESANVRAEALARLNAQREALLHAEAEKHPGSPGLAEALAAAEAQARAGGLSARAL